MIHAMELLPISTPILTKDDTFAVVLRERADLHDGDIVVISSKAMATTEGAAIELRDDSATEEACALAKKHNREPGFCQAVLDETTRMHGEIISSVHGFLLTELQPDGMEDGSILVPNAGLDRSNVADGYTIGWPVDPVASLKQLRDALDVNVALILSDSSIAPRRKGVVAFALAACGIDPFIPLQGTHDLFRQELQVTEEAIADQLATAANILMGNSNQATPAAIIRNHTVPFSNFCGWVPGIKREEDLYHGVI